MVGLRRVSDILCRLVSDNCGTDEDTRQTRTLSHAGDPEMRMRLRHAKKARPRARMPRQLGATRYLVGASVRVVIFVPRCSGT
jgi:hypothetical protein